MTADRSSCKGWIKLKWENKYTERLGISKLVEFEWYHQAIFKDTEKLQCGVSSNNFETSGNTRKFSPKAYLKTVELISISEGKVKEMINL